MYVFVYFADILFCVTEINVDVSPDAIGIHSGVKYMRQRWDTLYFQYYVVDMKALDLLPVKLNAFCEIRSRCRPSYKRHRKVSI